MNTFIDQLNDSQRRAVTNIEGPLLVLAGAGTGKTRVLVTRLSNILLSGQAFPSQVLAVTFTNKAALEMKERTAEMIGQSVEGLWIGTFHSIGAKILRRHADLIGFESNFTIINTDDQIRLVKQLLQMEKYGDKKADAKFYLSIINSWKDRGLFPEDIRREELVGSEYGEKALHIYKLYQERLMILSAMDFGDLLLNCLKLFKDHAHILEDYQRRFKYILVDEYQDTNVSQYLWLRLLAQKQKNICCVGDDDQSIYGWRGAEVGNILRFEKDFPGGEIVRLEQNYRSTPHILGAASGLIRRNKGRLGKELWTEKKEGDPIVVKGTWDGEAEARFVAEEVESLQRQGRSLSEAAILLRAGFQTREFEEVFLSMGIPYRIIGGVRFYERQEIRDALAYLRLVFLPTDDLAFERIVNVPRRGIGQATLQKIHIVARDRGICLTEATMLLMDTDEIKGKTRAALLSFFESIKIWRDAAKTLAPQDLAKQILEESGYTDMWRKDKSVEASGRLENLKEFVNALSEFADLESFLEHVSLVMENAATIEDEYVTLMTIHSAKGLEFPYVFLAGWEDGIFPSQKTLLEGSADRLEEERRLAYVAITRAKEQLYITFAANRRLHGQWQNNVPSRFISELPKEHIMLMQNDFQKRNLHIRPNFGGGPKRALHMRQSGRTGIPSSSSGFKLKDRVFHAKFGYGNVIAVSAEQLIIDFEDAGHKRVLESFLKKA